MVSTTGGASMIRYHYEDHGMTEVGYRTIVEVEIPKNYPVFNERQHKIITAEIEDHFWGAEDIIHEVEPGVLDNLVQTILYGDNSFIVEWIPEWIKFFTYDQQTVVENIMLHAFQHTSIINAIKLVCEYEQGKNFTCAADVEQYFKAIHRSGWEPDIDKIKQNVPAEYHNTIDLIQAQRKIMGDVQFWEFCDLNPEDSIRTQIMARVRK